MRKIQALFICFTLAVVGRAEEPTAETLKECPNGHTTLKNVRIVYGLPPFEGPAADKWEEAVRNLEVVSGGCEILSDSPKHEVICTTCHFTHSIISTDSPENGRWTLQASDLADFPKPISDFAKSFPVPPSSQQIKSVSYTQSLNDQLEVSFEGVGYSTTGAVEEIKAAVDGWAQENEINLRFSTRAHVSTLNGAKRDILEWKTVELSVSIMMHHEHSDKSSWVSATFYKRP